MPDFRGLLARITESLDAHGVAFMVIGGQAVLVHGEPRLTQDIDITLAADPHQLLDILAVCSDLGLEPLPEDVPAFVRTTYVLPAADPETGIRVDLIFSSTPYEAEAIARARRVNVGEALVPFATAEDLILHKLFAGRPRDIDDAVGVVRRRGTELDWKYLRRWAEEFAHVEGKDQVPAALEALRGEL